ncbi:unnamed protein product [Amoebophrya sp. A120]|nr:unnamed protein product [Amoebophrya sp. A120]|eukprot:GSA120T00013128001.1
MPLVSNRSSRRGSSRPPSPGCRVPLVVAWRPFPDKHCRAHPRVSLSAWMGGLLPWRLPLLTSHGLPKMRVRYCLL